MQGWTKLHRKLLNNPIFKKPALLQLFTYCLLRANHNETKIIWNGKEEILEKGCFITGRKAIAIDTGQTESAIYKRLKVLQDLKIISVKSNNRFSIVKVCNYCIFQGEENEKEQLGNNKVTTREQLGNTDKNVKNVKNVKNDKKINESNMNVFRTPSLDEIITYCQERKNDVDAEKWHNFYSSKGWMVGKNKMTDWKAAVRTWENKKDKPNRPKSWDAIDEWSRMREGLQK